MNTTQRPVNPTAVYLSSLFNYVVRLSTEFYENTLDFRETLIYVHSINAINTAAAKILKNNTQSIEYCQDMNIELRALELEFSESTQLKHIVRSIIIQNDMYINRLKNTPKIEP